MKYDICVVGGCSVDQMFYQQIDGTYSETPDMIVPGGKGSNQAVAAARAGAKVTMITKLGKDNIGNKIIENLNYNMVDTFNIELVDNLENDYSNIYINIKDKDNDIHRFGKAINSFDIEMIKNNEEVILNSNIIVCQLKCPIEVTEYLINFCYDNNKTLILTPCRPEKLTNRYDLIEKIGLIMCNEKECEIVFGTNDIDDCVSKYPNKLIVTQGSSGLLFHNGERLVKMPAIDVDVIDTTGAGDTLAGNTAAFLANGSDLQHALRKAMYASAMKLTEKSAQAGMPYESELDTFIFEKRNTKFDYSNELNLAIQAVKEAYFRVKTNHHFKINVKDDNSLVTDVDLAIEDYLISEIKIKFPNDNFLTEENHPDAELKDRTWIIDPLDGTHHFIKHTPFWGIQLAFYDKGNTKFSVIYLPISNQFFYAFENNGVYINNDKVLDIKVNPLNQAIVEFGGSIYKEFESKAVYLNKLMKDNKLLVGNILHINSCCTSYTNLVNGNTDALIISSKKKWDIMPGLFLCKEAGFKVYPLDFDNKLTLITKNEEIKDILMNIEK